MPLEIERKFLVAPHASPRGQAVKIVQGYFPMRDGFGRVRLQGRRGFVTVKGPPRGIVREEAEFAIPAPLARLLLDRLCTGGRIEKVRRHVRHGGRTWEVDVFEGANRGLVVAEIELRRENEKVALPPWAGPEVSTDPRFNNSSLARRPWLAWPARERTKALRG